MQLSDFISQTHESLMMGGMSSAAADLYYTLPVWMKAAFGLGSVGGFVGSMLLGLRRTTAMPVLAASLLGYIALFAGDYAHGVFDVIDDQMAILSFVVVAAAALLAVSVLAGRRQLLSRA